ncbi:hypothetical protein RJ640_013398 [Escallonia rubra]|uniref:Myb/SANT-like domain-containing protein n=1 Tax=Escallonia rubra TaxID=112253 RepID=A0AA88R009_9ASTE|nr:hypothetical protein RJ640_013398 [Escallonia rubra]
MVLFPGSLFSERRAPPKECKNISLSRRREREMGKRARKEGETSDKCTNFRWSIPIDRLFLEILADEATKRNKPSSSFKPTSFVRVAQAINEKFGCGCSPLHVENHLRTVKKT